MDNFSTKINGNSRTDAILPNVQSPIIRLNTICPYFTMFPLNFPYSHLSSAQPEDWVLDPFCGRGTTNFAARLRQIPSYGIDSSPIACAISAVKYVYATPNAIAKLCAEILNDAIEPVHIPQGGFWELCYHPSTLKEICILREAFLKECETDNQIALRALLLGILHGPKTKTLPSYLSNQMPRTYSTKPDYSVHYWKHKDLLPQQVDVLDVVTRRANYTFMSLPPKIEGKISWGDARNPLPFKPADGFNWIITSPPYFGMRTYVQDQWLRNWFLGGPDSVDYTVNDQIIHSNRQVFVQELSAVWKNVTSSCAPGTKMIVRFGALPSFACNPIDLIEESIVTANCGWEKQGIGHAGIPRNGRRQADQFGAGMGTAREEIDYYAVLT